MTKIQSWNAIKDSFKGGTLILGNGASIAVHEKFKYPSLREKAALKRRDKKLFNEFNSDNFEEILQLLNSAKTINRVLGICDEEKKLDNSYERVRRALIEIISKEHVDYNKALNHLPHINVFIKYFRKIMSLNYDMIPYWAMMYDLGNLKDSFRIKGEFAPEITPKENEAWVYYPHGNLSLITDENGVDKKISQKGSPLLSCITDQWKNGTVPLIITEGSSKQKRQAIGRSAYLSHVFDHVIPQINSKLVIYGWSMRNFDQHIIDQINWLNINDVAISVYTKDNDYEEYCERIMKDLKKQNKNINITFFDASSPGCWKNPAQE